MDIQLAPDQQKQLEALAREQGMSVEQAIAELLRQALSSSSESGVGVNGGRSPRDSKTPDDDVAARQHAAMENLFERLDALPPEPEPDDGLSGSRDHDRILYGGPE